MLAVRGKSPFAPLGIGVINQVNGAVSSVTSAIMLCVVSKLRAVADVRMASEVCADFVAYNRMRAAALDEILRRLNVRDSVTVAKKFWPGFRTVLEAEAICADNVTLVVVDELLVTLLVVVEPEEFVLPDKGGGAKVRN